MIDDPNPAVPGGDLAGQDRDARGRFLPGNRASNGRRRGARNRATEAREAIEALTTEHAEAIVQSLVANAVAGDVQAAALLLPRIWPARKGGAPIQIDLPEILTAADVLKAHAIVVAAVASGEITVDEGQALALLVDGARRAIETTDLERRVQALEDASEDDGDAVA